MFSYISIADRFSISNSFHEASIMLYGIKLNNPSTFQSFRGQPSEPSTAVICCICRVLKLNLCKAKTFYSVGTIGLDSNIFSPILLDCHHGVVYSRTWNRNMTMYKNEPHES